MKLAGANVRIRGFHPRLTWALLQKCDAILREALGYEPVITSGNDGRHSYTSLHYAGSAVDLRSWDSETSGIQIPMTEKKLLAQKLNHAVGNNFDVVAESDHIHLEYQPKRPTGVIV